MPLNVREGHVFGKCASSTAFGGARLLRSRSASSEKFGNGIANPVFPKRKTDDGDLRRRLPAAAGVCCRT